MSTPKPRSRLLLTVVGIAESLLSCPLILLLNFQFPAHLSHRSGISNTLFSWVRSCFAKGMGGKQVSDAIREQHLLHYDHTRLQYYNVLCLRTLDGWVGKKYNDFSPFNDNSPNGPRNFLPCVQWLRDMYSQFMEAHRNSINQHTAMRSNWSCDPTSTHPATVDLPDNIHSHSNHRSYYKSTLDFLSRQRVITHIQKSKPAKKD